MLISLNTSIAPSPASLSTDYSYAMTIKIIRSHTASYQNLQLCMPSALHFVHKLLEYIASYYHACICIAAISSYIANLAILYMYSYILYIVIAIYNYTGM